MKDKPIDKIPTWIVVLLGVAALLLVLIVLPDIMEKEDARYAAEKRELALKCLDNHGGYPVITPDVDNNPILIYTTSWEITSEELRALLLLDKYYSITLHTQ